MAHPTVACVHVRQEPRYSCWCRQDLNSGSSNGTVLAPGTATRVSHALCPPSYKAKFSISFPRSAEVQLHYPQKHKRAWRGQNHLGAWLSFRFFGGPCQLDVE